KAETGHRLRCADFDRRPAAFCVQAQQNRFGLNAAVLGTTGGQYADACTNATLFVNDLQASTSQQRWFIIRAGFPKALALGKQSEKEDEIRSSERKQELLAFHERPPAVIW